jgi:hypothetical protein
MVPASCMTSHSGGQLDAQTPFFFRTGMIVADFEFVRHNSILDFRLTLQRRHKFCQIAIVKPRNEAQKTCFKFV